MVELPNKIEKAEIADKPRVVFNGIIEEIDTVEKADHAIEILRKERVVGFDTETRPSFTRGQGHKIALLQLSTESVAYLELSCFFNDPMAISNLISGSSA